MVAAYPYLWDGYAGDMGAGLLAVRLRRGLLLAPVAWAALSGKWAACLVPLLAHGRCGSGTSGGGCQNVRDSCALAVVTVRDFRRKERGSMAEQRKLDEVVFREDLYPRLAKDPVKVQQC